MSLMNGVWSDLKFMAGDAAGSMLTNLAYRVHRNKDAGDVQYIYQRAYKNVLVFAAKRYLVQKAERELKAILPAFKRNAEKDMWLDVRKQQDTNLVTIIKHQQRIAEKYGVVQTKEGEFIAAKDRYGRRVPEAMILSFDGDTKVNYYDVETTNLYKRPKYGYNSYKVVKESKQTSKTIKTVTRVHIDLSPEINMNSNKNLVLTQVTGRDYTRKELISGGDLVFTVNGSIVGNEQGVYPEDKVKAFMEIMQYNGIINVNSFFFGNLNVKQILIKDFNLGKQEYMNVQPYSFSCVAVEPDAEIKLVKDTIQELNSELILSPVNKWYKLVLNNKLDQIAANAVATAAVNATSMGLDALTEWNNTEKDA